MAGELSPRAPVSTGTLKYEVIQNNIAVKIILSNRDKSEIKITDKHAENLQAFAWIYSLIKNV